MSFFKVRAFKPEDKNFIMATFLRGMYYGDSWFSLMPKDLFMQYYTRVAEALLERNAVMVACLPDDEDVILGYSIISFDFTTIHFVFVKSAFRKRGITKQLLPQYPTTVTHLTDLGRQLLPRLKNCVFNPFAI